MYVKQLKAVDYRNYITASAVFASGLNVIRGENAQGKTNLIEAIYFSGVGKSFRTPREKELIRSGCERSEFTVTAAKDSGDDCVRVTLYRDAPKRVYINDFPITKIGELMGVCPVVLFSPDELKIVKESPADRRRFIDISLCQISRAYFYALTRYNRTLISRNKLLKTGGYSANDLAVWDEMLAREGARIIKTRRGYIARLAPEAEKAHAMLTDGGEKLTVEYEGLAGNTVDEVAENFLRALHGSRERDERMKFTGVGAHKDDLSLAINGSDVRVYGSQGQQRTCALALKLAETELMTETIGYSPVLLLDDVLSELDVKRKAALMQAATGRQTIITTTDFEGDANILTVKNGVVTNE